MINKFEHLTKDKLEYYTEKLKFQIGKYYYNKEEIDNRSEHSAQAYYYSSEKWNELNPVLAPGELGIDSTNGFMKIGDGVHKWSEMDFAIFPVSLSNRSDNLLLKDTGDNLFLGEADMKNLILQVIQQYHGEADITEFTTNDGYSFITADGYTFVQKEN